MSGISHRFVAEHVRDLPRSGIRDFFALVQQMPQAISLGIGEPDFVTPWNIREAAIYSLERGRTSYTDNLGLLALRRTIADYVAKVYGMQYHGDKEVLVGIGVSEVLDTALRATLNAGDKVLYHQPCYVSYSPSIQLARAVPVPIQCKAEHNFALQVEDLEAAWQPGTKAIILNFPTNPTGGVMSREETEKIAKFCVEKDLLVFSDEIYAELTYEGQHVSIATFPGMQERTIFLHGLSKAWAMTGFRIGYACAPQPIIEAMMKVHQYSIMSVSIFTQEAAVEALKRSDDSVNHMRDSYHRRRDFLVRRFNEMGLTCHLPRATFYTFPSVAITGMDEKTFCQTLLKEEEVAVVPGTAFGPAGAGFVRASFSTSFEKLQIAADRIERFVQRHTK
ncbi:MAG: aminotransferase class I/II-fold pyridoxal phosphate-dependent enzyme [Verrucomicrobiota bacterium JB022]|nr:aminotransferase class I/II-fold pyridoxal phosphate-dependent enzyme [Verrucomicrobiota bacterium JB022]